MAQRPYVLLSAAMSADGYIDDASGGRLVLSDEADLDRVDELRAGSDAILVGARTIRRDNPGLLVRSAARRQRRASLGLTPSPQKVTITASGRLDPQSRFFAEADSLPLVYAAAGATGDLLAKIAAVATVLPVPTLPVPGQAVPGQADPGLVATGGADLAWILADLAARGIERLMVEGGASVLGQFLSAGLADEFLLAVAPVLVGDPAAPRLLAGGGLAGRLHLAAVAQVGDMAVLRYLPGGRRAG
jgi:5-amino-6-(5-phosphoribosylamino)uracil reductase